MLLLVYKNTRDANLKNSKSGRLPILSFLNLKKKLFKVEICQLNLKNASKIQNFPTKMPKIGQNMSEKCI